MTQAILFLGLKVFFVRIIDVSLGTLRTIITVKGKHVMASLIGFAETFVWFVVVKEALNTGETSLWIALFYASGFACGTYIGSRLSDHFITGSYGLQVITSKRDNKMVEAIRSSGYAVSVIDVKGKRWDKKYMLYIEIGKRNLKKVKALVRNLDPKAFIVTNETKSVYNGYFQK